MKILPAHTDHIQETADTLHSGGLIVYPTETVYGLGADPFNQEAMDRLYTCKGRDTSNPVLMIIGEPEQLKLLVKEISPQAQACIEAFWPGPLSLLLPKHESLSPTLTAGSEWVCVRCPGNEIAREICTAFGGPVTSTSVNRSGAPPAVSIDEIQLAGISLALDAGILQSDLPSTIYNPQTGEILRQGAITGEALKNAVSKA